MDTVSLLDQAVHMETAFFGKEQADRNLPSYTKHVLVSSYPVVTYKMAEDFLDELVVIPLAGEIPEEMREPAFFEKIKEERDAIVTIAIRSYECCHKMSGRFSGYYPVNCIPLPPPCEKICTNKEEAVQQFAETRCERNQGRMRLYSMTDLSGNTAISHSQSLQTCLNAAQWFCMAQSGPG